MAVISVRGSTDGTAPQTRVAGWQTTVTGIVVHREKILSSSNFVWNFTLCISCTFAQSKATVKSGGHPVQGAFGILFRVKVDPVENAKVQEVQGVVVKFWYSFRDCHGRRKRPVCRAGTS